MRKKTRRFDVLLLALCVFIAFSFYFGSFDPRVWISISFSNVAPTVIETLGKIVVNMGGGGTPTSTIKIYSESDCINEVSSINWGSLSPGQSRDTIVYIKNTGTPVTLSLSTRNWSPVNAEQYMTLTWDYNNQTIQASNVLRVILTLTVSGSVKNITDFSFEIVITASST